jgi:LPS-assembly protein
MSLRLSPYDSENISSLDRQINITNLFSNNRLGLLDSLEGGQSLTFAFDYNLLNNNDRQFFSYSMGQIFRDTNDEKLPLKSTMQNKRSDLIGRFEFSPTDNFEMNYNFSADNDMDTMNYNFLETKFRVNNFVTSFEFLEENNMVGTDSYFSKNMVYNFNSNNTLKYNTRRNRKTDLTEYYNLIYEYRNDCLVAAIEYNKDYYEDRDIKPNEEIYFSITLTPITSINTPNFSK